MSDSNAPERPSGSGPGQSTLFPETDPTSIPGSRHPPQLSVVIENALKARGATNRIETGASSGAPSPGGATPGEMLPHEDPQLPKRLVATLLAEHRKLLNQLRDQNGTALSEFGKRLEQAFASIDLATSVLKDESQQTRTALGHLESATRELRQETLRCQRLIEEAPRRLEITEKALRQSLDLLHGMLRPTLWLFVSAVLSLMGLGAYTAWREFRSAPRAASSPASPPQHPASIRPTVR